MAAMASPDQVRPDVRVEAASPTPAPDNTADSEQNVALSAIPVAPELEPTNTEILRVVDHTNPLVRTEPLPSSPLPGTALQDSPDPTLPAPETEQEVAPLTSTQQADDAIAGLYGDPSQAPEWEKPMQVESRPLVQLSNGHVLELVDASVSNAIDKFETQRLANGKETEIDGEVSVEPQKVNGPQLAELIAEAVADPDHQGAGLKFEDLKKYISTLNEAGQLEKSAIAVWEKYEAEIQGHRQLYPGETAMDPKLHENLMETLGKIGAGEAKINGEITREKRESLEEKAKELTELANSEEKRKLNQGKILSELGKLSPQEREVVEAKYNELLEQENAFEKHVIDLAKKTARSFGGLKEQTRPLPGERYQDSKKEMTQREWNKLEKERKEQLIELLEGLDREGVMAVASEYDALKVGEGTFADAFNDIFTKALEEKNTDLTVAALNLCQDRSAIDLAPRVRSVLDNSELIENVYAERFFGKDAIDDAKAFRAYLKAIESAEEKQAENISTDFIEYMHGTGEEGEDPMSPLEVERALAAYESLYGEIGQSLLDLKIDDGSPLYEPLFSALNEEERRAKIQDPEEQDELQMLARANAAIDQLYQEKGAFNARRRPHTEASLKALEEKAKEQQ